ncbi:hypothetical protein MAPG_07397 [Magnaporthiopsis poae ATCC 64411]|uniref:Uncharacterized protein n=1 Tax=Magnaporthiopsis poae (strain ATCC 64411 / 73-15) TaxID=644358 RepID=A0A0C4E4K1_MAGP6|nr:hypothetical protein MAPG_07397 [Magnaporthiopsis poae ATCC 64411]
MTRSEPLTSLALGRSPYDEVRMGEGEGDPRAPVQLYDEHGRPVNPDARRLNRELIRAHNEVMLAIGVAEPDDGAAERKELEERENARMEAERIGSRLSATAQLQVTVSYNDNALTRLPASLAADMLTVVSSNLIQAPMEAFALRLLARSFLGRNGGSVADVYTPTPWRGVTWMAVGSLVQVEMVHLLIKGEVWSIFTLLSDMFREEIQNN